MFERFGARAWRRSAAVLLGSALVIPTTGLVAAQSASAADQPQTVTDGQATWGVKASFRNYIEMPVFKGKIVLSEGLQKNGGNYIWSPASGSYNTDTKSGVVAFGGKAHFESHYKDEKALTDPILDLTMYNVRVKFEKGVSTLVVDADSRPFTDTHTQNAIQHLKDVTLATFDSAPSVEGQALKFNGTPKLTKAGVEMFGTGFYEEGTALDPMAVSASLKAPEPTPTRTPEPSSPAPSSPAPSSPAPTTTPKPTQPTTPAPTAPSLGNGELTWGVKTSFRNYIKSPITMGTWTMTDGLTYDGSQYHWKLASSNLKDGVGTLNYRGTLRFTGHDNGKGTPILDMTFKNVRIKISNAPSMARSATSTKSAQLIADLSSRKFIDTTTVGPMEPHNNVVIANLTGTVEVSSTQVKGINLGAPLTSQGATAFGGFYKAGEALDPVSFVAASNPGQATLPGGNTNPTTAPTTQPAPSTSAVPTSGPSTSNKAPGTKTHTCTVKGADSGSLDWGVKTSFRNYIKGGIAQGDWSTDGASYSGGQFHWPLSGKASGTLTYSGSVHFTGHHGLLDVRLANMRVNVNGSSSATLVADVDTSDMSGKKSHYDNVSFATLSGSITTKGTDMSGNGLSATLTADGAKAFAGFYSAGQAMDPISFSSSATTRTATCDEHGNVVGALPKTGADIATDTQHQSEQILLALALAGLLGSSVVIARRAKQQA